MPRPPTPPPIIIPNCIMVALHWQQAGENYSNVIHGNLTAAGPINPALPETLFSAFKANTGFSAFIGAHIHTDVSFVGVTVKDLRAGNNPTFSSTGAALAGGATGSLVALSAALVVTHRTGQSGRAFRGRTYFAGLTSTDLATARTWTGLAGTSAVTAMQGIQSVMITNSIPMVVAQQRLMAGTTVHGAPLPERLAGVVPIVSFDIANPRVDSQRRRLGR